MRLFLPFLLFAFLLLSCDEKKAENKLSEENSIFEMEFNKYTDHIAFKNYKKITDTSFYLNPKDFNPEFGIQEIENSGETIIIFKDILWQENINKRTGFKILDTLHLNKRNRKNYISIGYCFQPNLDVTNIIAVVERTEELHPKNILRAWKANPTTGKIEEIKVDNLECWNEHYEE